jgi:hypothetical protein
MFLHWQEGYANGVLANTGQGKSQGATLTRKELMGNLNQNAGSITGLWIAAARAAMRQIDKDLNSLLNNLMALLAANARYKTDTAGVMLVRRIIKTLRRRQTVIGLPQIQRGLPKGLQASALRNLYIYLLQRFRVKSTIQNFDAQDGKFCGRKFTSKRPSKWVRHLLESK